MRLIMRDLRGLMGSTKITSGRYQYKGYDLLKMYYHPERRYVWEAVNLQTGESDYRAFTKSELIADIDADT